MARKSSIESRIVQFFQSASEDATKAVYGILSGIVKERFPRTVKKAATRRAKQVRADGTDPVVATS